MSKEISSSKNIAFSLVELMVVIAIIGILSAIAVPSYKNYVIRAKFAEIFSLLGPYKIETSQAFDTTGNPPSNRTDNKNTALVKRIELYVVDTNVEMIHIYPQNFYPEYGSTGNEDRFILQGKMKNDILTWTCCIHDTAGVPGKYLPSNCQILCTVARAS